MKLLTVLTATAVAAAVAAALSIPAGAQRSNGDDATKLATCLHAHGAAGAPSGADALKQWLATRADTAAVKACVPQAAAPTDLLSCLRAHGLNPPDDLYQLKPWMVRQAGTGAGKAALGACGVDFGPPEGAPTGDKAPAKGSDCGGGAATPAKKPAAAAKPTL